MPVERKEIAVARIPRCSRERPLRLPNVIIWVDRALDGIVCIKLTNGSVKNDSVPIRLVSIFLCRSCDGIAILALLEVIPEFEVLFVTELFVETDIQCVLFEL